MKNWPIVVALCLQASTIAVAQKRSASSSSPPSATTAAATSSAAATSTPGVKPPAKKTPAAPALSPQAQYRKVALMLLERSHSYNDQLEIGEHLFTLQRQLQIAAKLDLKLSRGWADEFIDLSRYVSDPDRRSQMQSALVWNLSTTDPTYALQILSRIPAPTSRSDERDARIYAARELFSSLLAKNGEAGLAQLHDEAIRLGSENAYPYYAMADVALQIEHTRPARPAGKAQAPTSLTALQICREAIEFYQRSNRTLAGDLDFADMIEHVSPLLPPDLTKDALRSLGFNLMASAADLDLGDKKSSEQVDFNQGRNLADGALIRLVSLLKATDPELYKQIKQSRPAVAYFDSPQSGALLSDANSVGIRATATINEPPSVQGEANAGSNDPVIATTAQTDSDPHQNKELELESLTVQAQAASKANNAALLRQSLSRGFQIGDDLLRSHHETDPKSPTVGWDALAGLVQVGMETEPELTVSYIDQLSLPGAQANLLILAANVLLTNSETQHPPRTSASTTPPA